MKTLPLHSNTLYLSDGGLETWMVFHEQIALRDFAAFEMLLNRSGRDALRTYYRRYARIAEQCGRGFVFESPTWRASQDWGDRLGYDPGKIVEINRKAIGELLALRNEFPDLPALISGCVGPRGDGYSPAAKLTAYEAQAYHMPQIAALATAGAQVISAITMTHVGEAIGIVRAATALGLPCVISFTAGTDGHLPDGTAISAAIWAVDAATGNAPAHYMLNCAHPSHFEHSLEAEADWLGRIGGIKANASRLSHAELDCATVLDDGDPEELAESYCRLQRLLPNLRVVSGCCGTDHRHVAAIGRALAA